MKFCATVSDTVVVAVNAPEVPVIVTVPVPPGAVELAVSVNTVPVVDEVGLKDRDTPTGRAAMLNVTVPVKPLVGFTVIVLVPPAPPGTIDTLVGFEVSVKFGGGVTVTATVVVAVTLPDVPVIVTVVVPAAADALAVKVTTVVAVPLAGGVSDVGTNAAVTPVGRVEVVNVVAALKPLTLVSVIVLPTPGRVGVIDMLAGFDDRVNDGGAVTVREIVVVSVTPPPTPEMVTVEVPAEAEAPAVRVSVLVVPVGFGLNPAVTPVGSPLALRVTLPLNPPASVTVMVLVLPVRVGVMVKLLGAAVSENGATTVSETVAV